MNSISYINSEISSHIVNEDYFAIKVVYDSSIELTKYIGFYYGDTDFLEFAIDRNSHIIKKFQLVVCNHFEIIDDDLSTAPIYESGCISINLPQHNDCNAFIVYVYRNAVDILLSRSPVNRIIRCGQVLFGLTNNYELVNITVLEMSASEISHTKEELNFGISND